jgi:sugar phosphate isomerase/epimerase
MFITGCRESKRQVLYHFGVTAQAQTKPFKHPALSFTLHHNAGILGLTSWNMRPQRYGLMRRLKVGIDNYGLYPLRLEPLEALKWAAGAGAEGVQFSGLEPSAAAAVDKSYLEDLGQFASSEGLYLEWGGAQHIPREMNTWGKKEIFDINRKAALEARLVGAAAVRSCSGGLMRWRSDSPPTETLLTETADALSAQKSMLKDHAVILAIETHFEFTTHELLRLFEMCDAEPGDWLGVCLDTMNLLTMLEDPVAATERILPWVVSTHIKDGGIVLTQEGMGTFPVEIGTGIVDIEGIARRLAMLPREINLSIEDHGGWFDLPVLDPLFLSRFPDLTAQEFARLLRLAQATEEKRKRGESVVTEREKWPDICRERIKRDISTLKKTVVVAGRNLA